MSVRVLIVDDHAVVRTGLRLLLEAEDDLEPVGEAGSARDAVFQARALKPDVILLDIVMPDQTGLEVLPTILRNFDRVSMAHGIEVRMPFMDWRLVTYTTVSYTHLTLPTICSV